MIPTVVAVGGFASNVGKTTLVCEMLRRLPGWEAIKLTRGHYRSCGKDPHACCVSHLLSDQPLVQSGRENTYTAGKDTARFWDAGAANVHWVIATTAQVREGVLEALARVRSAGVIIEGTSPISLLPMDYAVMVARPDGERMKPSARKALVRVNAVFTSDGKSANLENLAGNATIYTSETFDALIADVKAHSSLMVTRI
jgi:molybdopterin-guanine dinucleotide biosynthesis protein